MRRAITFFTGIFVLIGLIFLINMKGRDDGGETDEIKTSEAAEAFTLLEREGVQRIEIETKDGSLNLFLGDEWLIEGFEDVTLNSSNVLALVSCFETLKSSQKIDSTDLAEYGLAPPEVTAKASYADGSNITLNLGVKTPDGQYYYLSLSDGYDGIYLADRLYGDRFYYNIGDMIDKYLPTVSAYEITCLNIIQKGRDEILIEYDAESDVNKLIDAGMQTLEMKKPIEKIPVYPSNLQSHVLKNLSALKFKDLAEASCDDLSKYGLSEPFLELRLEDMNYETHLLFGDYDSSGENIYCRKSSDRNVFTMDKTAVLPFIDVDIYKFAEKFISLKYKDSLDSVLIVGDDTDYTITFDEETNFINGKKIENEQFNPFYELLIGISFDAIDKNIEESYFTNPVLTIIYVHEDKTLDDTVCEYYTYNDNFYIASKDGDGIYLVSRQSVNNMLNKLKQL